MAPQLRALLIDDSEDDAFLLLRHLRKNGYEVTSERVETAEALRAAIARGGWDIALSDYVMPLLTGEEALRILAAEAPDLPVITVSGNVGEEFAVSVMRAGAKDYVRKDALSRLIPAIERELADAARRRERHKLEQQLSEAEGRAAAMFASMHQGVIYRDAEGKITAANPAASRILGLGLDQLVGQVDPGWRLVREDGSRLPAEEHPALVSLRTRRSTHDTVLGVDTDGERRWILIDAVPEFRPGEDAPYRVFSTFSDITERKRAEAALLASEERYHEMAEVLPQVVWVTGPDGSVRYTNGRWTEYSGQTEEAAAGEGWLEGVHPDDREAHRATWQVALHDGSGFEITSRLRRRDGAYHRFHVAAMPVRDQNGAIVRWTGVSTDIENQKQLEDDIRNMNAALAARVADTSDQLHASEERMRLAFRASQEGIWDWNVETGHIWYSGRWGEMLGYTPEEVQPTYEMWRTAVHPDDLAFVEEAVTALMRGDQPYDTVYRLRHKAGHYITVQSRAVVERRESTGSVVRVIGTHRDITELKRTEASLRAAVEDLEAFNYSVSHDLRAPLRHIEGYTEIIEQEYGARLPDEVRGYVEKVHAGSERMSAMIEALLQLSRIGRAAIERRRTDMSALAKAAWAELASAPGAARAVLTVHDLPEADADPALVRHVFDNLLGNAIKFSRTAAEPRIEVGVERIDGEPVFFVRDNGVGFDSQRAGQLFAPFRRAHMENEFEGAGIGLAIVKRVVEKHGGRVWAEGDPGHGATIFFTLPPRADS